jgi:cell division septal protein FtsQ
MKKALLTGAGIGVALLLTAGAVPLLRSLSFFEVRRLELIGGRYLTPAAVAGALAVRPGTSVFDELGSLEVKARALPGVVEAKVSRRIPGTIRVTVREAEPVALAERGGRLVLLDASGRVLPFDPTQPAADLPIAEVDPVVTGVLALVRDIDPELFALVERGSRVRQDVALQVAAGRILFRAGVSGAEIRDLSLVAGDLARRGRGWRELDARFSSRVIVRGAGA